ncbi:Bug family tripartite tricarboxylate transporter substrate binding protein [Caldovatus aquaticus]|uniref:Tripartite tricarboxylate transporter substrate binding protein n=1 Tax=Caldovatus aquaticus TaxID=2865671 RepID=A0ABS7F1Z9_9PROT|nr:tripartite tricarboxylate transporter substrate binding protein [Caldovatus aquaticus]MBW8268821.1 tripartite tricarboxylate transporter substrate binding protein [Caldovatus aquaticus]
MPSRRTALLGAALGLGALAPPASRAARAEEAWPTRPVRLVIPFAPGGPIDTTGRLIAEPLRERLGQPFIVETRPGAGGSLGARSVAQSPPDGYTFLLTSSSLAINPAIHPNQGFDPIADLTPVSLVTEVPTAIAVRADSRFRGLADLLAEARARPGRVTYGSSGVGSSNHLAGALFATSARLDLLHVPYRGAAVAMNALYAGDVDLVFASTVEVMPHWRDGRARILAVTTPRRIAQLPDVPAAAELVPGYHAPNWYAMAGPRALGPAIVARFVRALQSLRDLPLIRERFHAVGTEPLFLGPEALAARLAEDVPKWRRVVAEAGIRAE